MSQRSDVDVAALRREYRLAGVTEDELGDDPLAALRAWLDEAVAGAEPEPNAMVLATVGVDGAPSARTVLCKGVDARGVVFYTNYTSRKATELSAHPGAAVVFAWWSTARQVTVRGNVERLPAAESDAYFASRPRGAQLSAWASRQSAPVGSRDDLERQAAAVAARFQGRGVPRPDFWGGYLLRPSEVEFWQGRPDRLHDRLRFTGSPGDWRVERLFP